MLSTWERIILGFRTKTRTRIPRLQSFSKVSGLVTRFYIDISSSVQVCYETKDLGTSQRMTGICDTKVLDSLRVRKLDI